MGDNISEDWTVKCDALVDQFSGDICHIRQHMHRYPEPSLEEFKTTEFIREQLVRIGLQPTVNPDKRGLFVDGGDAGDGPRIGLRADMDALRIQDAKELHYASRVEGVMHACGHDGHTATVMGAVMALEAMQSSGELPWPVRWRALFQPAEETNQGALAMIGFGALEGLDALLSLHMDPFRKVGTVGYREGAFTADCNEIGIEIRGRGAHAARPHESRDPIAAASQLISAIYLFVPRSRDSQEPVVVSFGQIAGGHSPNVIPDSVTVRGTLRTLHQSVTRETMDHIERLARGISEASGTTISVHAQSGPPAVFNDPALTRLVRHQSELFLGIENVHEIPRPSMGGEDFANYLSRIPGAMIRLGCSVNPELAAPLHSPQFDLDEHSLGIGAKILARSVVEWCNPARV